MIIRGYTIWHLSTFTNKVTETDSFRDKGRRRIRRCLERRQLELRYFVSHVISSLIEANMTRMHVRTRLRQADYPSLVDVRDTADITALGARNVALSSDVMITELDNTTPPDAVVYNSELSAAYAKQLGPEGIGFDECKVAAVDAHLQALHDSSIDGDDICIDRDGEIMAFRTCVKQKEKVILTELGLKSRKIPRDYNEFKRDPDSHHWWAGMTAEMDSQYEMMSWDREPLTEESVLQRGKTIVSSKWVWDLKTVKETHAITVWKARLVARGFEQGPEDYFEIYSGVVRYSTLRTCCALATVHDWECTCMDVKTAYLQAKLTGGVELYMYQPDRDRARQR